MKLLQLLRHIYFVNFHKQLCQANVTRGRFNQEMMRFICLSCLLDLFISWNSYTLNIITYSLKPTWWIWHPEVKQGSCMNHLIHQFVWILEMLWNYSVSLFIWYLWYQDVKSKYRWYCWFPPKKESHEKVPIKAYKNDFPFNI